MHKPTTLFKLLAFPAGLAWLALPCHAERAESIQAAPVMVESAAPVAASAFFGWGQAIGKLELSTDIWSRKFADIWSRFPRTFGRTSRYVFR